MHKLLLAAPFDGHSSAYVAKAFQTQGWAVKGVDYRAMHAVMGPKRLQEHLLMHAKDADLVLVLKGELIDPDTLRAIAAPTAVWNFDPREGQEAWVLERARAARHFFTIAKGLVKGYREAGINAHWLLEGADAFNHQPFKPLPAPPISFIGTVADVPGRETWMQAVVARFGYDNVRLYGSYCPPSLKAIYQGRAAGDAGFCQTVANTKVNLGSDRNPEIERSYGARLFRTLAAGGYLLTNRTVGIDEDFGGCLDTYVDTEHCLERIQWAFDHPEECRRIAETGRSVVLKTHTFNNRVREMIRVLDGA